MILNKFICVYKTGKTSLIRRIDFRETGISLHHGIHDMGDEGSPEALHAITALSY